MQASDFHMTQSFVVEMPPQERPQPPEADAGEASAHAVARRLKLPCIDLRRHDLDPLTVRRLSEAHARRFKALVLEERSDTCLVGFVDPLNLRAQDEIASLLARPIDVAVITEQQLLATIERVYRKTEQIDHFAREVGKDVHVEEDEVDLAALSGKLDEADAPIIKLLQTIFDDAARVNASDIHFEPQENALRVRLRIDGNLHPQVEADARIGPTLVVRLKLMAGLDIAERRLPQDGRFHVRSGTSRFDVRMSSMPTQYGESVVLRLLRQDSTRLKLAQIMPMRARRVFERALAAPHGMILVTGPTGSGKTTTLYAALDLLNKPELKILTCEDPVEYRLAGINQVQINDRIELTFARVLRSFLRQDPDVLLVGEIRDHETADIAARAAMTGHLVLSTLHTNDAASAPLRLLDMEVPGYLIASSLLAVVAQRLLRIVCTHCAAPDRPAPELLHWLRQRVDESELAQARFRRGRGCVHCNGSGFAGRRGVFEVLEMKPELALALQRGDPSGFERAARGQIGRYTMQRNAHELVLAGETTIAEAMTMAAGGEPA